MSVVVASICMHKNIYFIYSKQTCIIYYLKYVIPLVLSRAKVEPVLGRQAEVLQGVNSLQLPKIIQTLKQRHN